MPSNRDDRKDRDALFAVDTIGAIDEEHSVSAWRLVLRIRFKNFLAVRAGYRVVFVGI
jgi:hypothetical protein